MLLKLSGLDAILIADHYHALAHNLYMAFSIQFNACPPDHLPQFRSPEVGAPTTPLPPPSLPSPLTQLVQSLEWV